MTRDDLLNLPAGPETDALFDELAMGGPPRGLDLVPRLPWSTDLATVSAAVIRALALFPKAAGFHIWASRRDGGEVGFSAGPHGVMDHGHAPVRAGTIPLAVVRAVLVRLWDDRADALLSRRRHDLQGQHLIE